MFIAVVAYARGRPNDRAVERPAPTEARA